MPGTPNQATSGHATWRASACGIAATAAIDADDQQRAADRCRFGQPEKVMEDGDRQDRAARAEQAQAEPDQQCPGESAQHTGRRGAADFGDVARLPRGGSLQKISCSTAMIRVTAPGGSE